MLHVSESRLHTDPRGCFCHDLQCGVRLLMGTDTVAVPTGDPAPQHPVQRSESLHGYELGVQLARRRDDADSSGVDSMAVVSGTRLLLRGQFCHRYVIFLLLPTSGIRLDKIQCTFSTPKPA